MTVLLTGVAGFIGYHTALKLLSKGYTVVGLDEINDYYDVRMKYYRLNALKQHTSFIFYQCSILNNDEVKRIFDQYTFGCIINLAARAGVRYSLENPEIYFSTNTIGTLKLLQKCVEYNINKFVLASTSSLYAGQPMPFTEKLPVNNPISPYAASKKAAEVTAYTYHYIYDIDVTVLRYFTVYGPAGRPDMSCFRFIKWIDEGADIVVYGDGTQKRDFTYVDDIAEGTIRAMETNTGYDIINLGGNNSHELNEMISLIEMNLRKKSNRRTMPFHKADLKATCANIDKAKSILKWEPNVPLEEGIKRATDWYVENKPWSQEITIDLNN